MVVLTENKEKWKYAVDDRDQSKNKNVILKCFYLHTADFHQVNPFVS